MREIKFRLWDDIDKRMISWEEIDVLDQEGIYPFLQMLKDRKILMQYIGLKDKNGREIYEGDIVTGWFNNQKIVGQIFYGSNAAFFIQRKDLLGISLINADVWVEIIGNIYENPELLNA